MCLSNIMPSVFDMKFDKFLIATNQRVLILVWVIWMTQCKVGKYCYL